MTPMALAFTVLSMVIARARLRFLCVAVFDHYLHLKFEGDRMFLACEVCGYESAGWSSGHEHYGRRLPGDARRHQSYARRFIA